MIKYFYWYSHSLYAIDMYMYISVFTQKYNLGLGVYILYISKFEQSLFFSREYNTWYRRFLNQKLKITLTTNLHT